MSKTWDLKKKSCEGNAGANLLSKPSATETDSLMPVAHHTRPTYDKLQRFEPGIDVPHARHTCQARHVFEWHWRGEPEIVASRAVRAHSDNHVSICYCHLSWLQAHARSTG